MLGLGLSLSSTPVIGGAINAPSFALDFRNGDNPVTKYGFTFTRATTATYVNSAGLLATAASGELRYDYDPVTLAPRGILVEEASTNLYPNSNALQNATYWINNGRVVLSSSGTAPDGSTATMMLEDSTASNTHGIYQNGNFAVTIGQVWTMSVYAKSVTGNTNRGLRLAVVNGASGKWPTAPGASFNLATGAVISATAGVSAYGMESVGGGWYRCWMTTVAVDGTGTTSASQLYGCDGAGANSYSGDGVSGLYLYGAQAEAKACATSYIPTTGAAATRNADALTLTGAAGRTNLIVGSAAPATQNVTTTATAYTLSHTGTGTITLSGTSTAGPLVGAGSLTFTPSAGTLTLTMSGTVTNAQLETGSSATTYIPTTNGPRTVENVASWFNGDAGTWVVHGRRNDSSAAVVRRMVSAGNAAGTQSINLAVDTNADSVLNVVANSAAQAAVAYAMTYGITSHKVAGAYAVNDFQQATDGALATADTSGALPYSFGNVYLGDLGTAAAHWNGTIAYLAYYPRRLSNASLQALTA